MRNWIAIFSLAAAIFSSFALSCSAQSENATIAIPAAAIPALASLPSTPTPAPAAETSSILSRFGIGAQVSSLGPGADLAFELTRRIDIRGGFNYFDMSENFTSNGINYGGSVKFQSGEAHLDYYFFHSFHVSPGILFSNGTLFGGTMNVPGGQSFTVNSDSYTSAAANPVTGTGALKFNKVSPSILFGIGSLVPRGKRRFSVRFEAGAAFRGAPTVGLGFTGTVCTQVGATQVCKNTATDAQFQSDVAAQQTKYNNDLSFLKAYPIISLGFGIRL